MAEIIEFKPRSRVRERKEVEVNWGLIGGMAFCIAFWTEVWRVFYTGHL